MYKSRYKKYFKNCVVSCRELDPEEIKRSSEIISMITVIEINLVIIYNIFYYRKGVIMSVNINYGFSEFNYYTTLQFLKGDIAGQLQIEGALETAFSDHPDAEIAACNLLALYTIDTSARSLQAKITNLSDPEERLDFLRKKIMSIRTCSRNCLTKHGLLTESELTDNSYKHLIDKTPVFASRYFTRLPGKALLFTLPSELLNEVFKHLDTQNQISLSMVCKATQDVFNIHRKEQLLSLRNEVYFFLKTQDQPDNLMRVSSSMQPYASSEATAFYSFLQDLSSLSDRQINSIESKEFFECFENHDKVSKIIIDQIPNYTELKTEDPTSLMKIIIDLIRDPDQEFYIHIANQETEIRDPIG